MRKNIQTLNCISCWILIHQSVFVCESKFHVFYFLISFFPFSILLWTFWQNIWRLKAVYTPLTAQAISVTPCYAALVSSKVATYLKIKVKVRDNAFSSLIYLIQSCQFENRERKNYEIMNDIAAFSTWFWCFLEKISQRKCNKQII